MKNYQDTISVRGAGQLISVPATGVSVLVNLAGTMTPATIYSDDGVTITTNPVTTDSSGRFNFYVADGRYDLVVSGANVVTYTQRDVEIADVTQSTLALDTTWNIGNVNLKGTTTATNPIVGSITGTAGFATTSINTTNLVGPGTASGNYIHSGVETFNGGITATSGQNTFTLYNINGDIYLDGIKYTTVAAAVAALASGGTLRIAAGTYSIASTITLVNNLDIECSPNGNTILQASNNLNGPIFSGTSISGVRIAGCVIDGNRSLNANNFSGIFLTSVTKSKIVNNHFQNFSGGRVIYLSSGSNFNLIQDNEIDHYGLVLPAVANGNECIALAPSGAGVGVQDNDILHNYCHDGNGGIGVYNSTAAPSVTNNTSRNRFFDNKIQALCNDAFLIFSSPTVSTLGSLIQANIFQGNVARCNGWPANGTGWDSTNCPPGLLQTGSSAGQGVGFNLNSSQADQNQFIGNRAEFNFFEGGDDTPQVSATVNTSNGALGGCSANCVQATSGAPFNTLWKANSGITINGVFFLIASVQSATVLTLTTAPGTQTGVASNGYMFSRSIWSGNYFYNNGNGALAGGQGSGLAIQGGYVTSSGNTSVGNAYSGFYDTGAVYVSHVGDHSLFNCRVAACNEFNVQVALNPTHVGVASDTGAGNNALFWSGMTTNGFAESPSLCNATGCGAAQIQDQGIGDVFSNGKLRGASNTNGGTHTLGWAVGTTFATLGTPANGQIIYCSDCTIANPCAGSGNGAIAKRLNGIWVCN